MMDTSGLRSQVSQISNDPWGPSLSVQGPTMYYKPRGFNQAEFWPVTKQPMINTQLCRQLAMEYSILHVT
jgi:hypothetical protein